MILTIVGMIYKFTSIIFLILTLAIGNVYLVIVAIIILAAIIRKCERAEFVKQFKYMKQ